MCGIAGAVALSSNPSIAPTEMGEVVRRMSALLEHRGPDGEGLWVDAAGAVAFAHRRLSIVELSDLGSQPMTYGDGRYCIVFNGEIYNFRELADELRGRGCTFRSSSDTEVLLAALVEYGFEGALEKLVGMFAFAFWDAHTRTLRLARDRMGEKPMHLTAHHGYLFFASEVKAFAGIPGYRPALSAQGVSSYLRYGYVPEPLSILEGVVKLPPGATLTIEAHGNTRLAANPLAWRNAQVETARDELRPRWYWSVADVARAGRANPVRDEKTAVEELEELLRRSVRAQLLCDVPVGALLSGGVDSSLVAAVMQSEASAPIRTFTVKFDNPDFDESRHARAVADHLHTIHEEFNLSQAEVLRSIPDLVRILDEPTANASIFPVHLIAKFARTRVKVILSGDGGDELFAGYNRYRLTPQVWNVARRIPRSLRNAVLGLARSSASAPGAQTALASMFALSPQARSGGALAKALRIASADDFSGCYDLAVACWPQPGDLGASGAVLKQQIEAGADDPLATMLLADQIGYLPGDSLAKVDRASMAAGLETRVPLLDHRLVDFSWRTRQLRGPIGKVLMRELLYKFVPREIIERPKMGFTVPVRSWLTGPLKPWADELLHAPEFASLPQLAHAAVIGAWREFQLGKGVSEYQMWAIVMLAAWSRSAAVLR